MSSIKYRLFTSLVALVSAVLLVPKESQTAEPIDTVPMPLHQGNLHGHSSNIPEPHRDDSVKKYLIPSVRIRVPKAAGSGTICAYDRNTKTAYVISCAHLYEGVEKPTTIEVFYKNDQKLSSPSSFPATIISFKKSYYGDDISIMSFKPDWDLTTWLPIAPLTQTLTADETLFSCGCDQASEVACYYVRPLGVDGVFLATRENSPRPGRSGGGLMNKDGWLVGICVRTSDVSGNGTGYFVQLKTIHDYLQQNNLAWLLNVEKPNDLLRKIPIIDKTESQGTYPPDYVPVP